MLQRLVTFRKIEALTLWKINRMLFYFASLKAIDIPTAFTMNDIMSVRMISLMQKLMLHRKLIVIWKREVETV